MSILFLWLVYFTLDAVFKVKAVFHHIYNVNIVVVEADCLSAVSTLFVRGTDLTGGMAWHDGYLTKVRLA